MEYDIRDTIANFVRKADPDFEKHREERKQRLRRSSCINPSLGRWMDIGVEFLFSVLELEDRDFTVRLPILAHLTKTDRHRFLRLLQEHVQVCHHCALKHEDELDLNARIERAFQDNSQSLLQELQSTTGLEADHQPISLDLIHRTVFGEGVRCSGPTNTLRCQTPANDLAIGLSLADDFFRIGGGTVVRHGG